jgi:ATPase family associated with various cellular activities (AAA)
MNALGRWQLKNNQFLAAALHWLRLRLKLLASADKENWQVTGEEIEQAARLMELAAAQEPPPALILLSQLLGLSDFERSLLLLCAAMELDTGIADLCAHAQDNSHRPYPTFALALACFDNPAWDVVSPERPLRYWRLIEINQSVAQPLTSSSLRADERIVNYIKGLNYLDDRLSALVFPLDPWKQEASETILPLPASGQEIVDAIAHEIKQAIEQQQFPILQLTGIDPPSKQIIAWQVCQDLRLHLYRLTLELLPTQGTLETIARLWQRESLLLPLALYIDVQTLDETTNSSLNTAALKLFLNRSDGIFFLDVREIGFSLERSTVTLDISKPTPSEQQQAWELALKSNVNGYPTQLANQFQLNLVEIWKIARNAEAGSQQKPLEERLWNSCLASTRPRLDTLAQRLEPKATWEDIVLPNEELDLLHQIAEQVRQRSVVYDEWGFRRRMNRGLGISALFAGESGTGKTMAAEVIANDLRLNLYRIDLSAVVSKFIGETEKNLRRLFDAAEDGGAILFFDEADALFGKRSEVKDSHDRYANIEINYLLQRLEAYRGLAILATNFKNALDSAFMRRLRFIVNFSFPGVKERKAMWQKAFPSETPTEELDFNRLAQFNLTGGSIHNIALNAAFLAAQAKTSVKMQQVLSATRTELRKCDRPINESDFRWQVPEEVKR